MHTAASVSNIAYYSLKKKAGLHNQGFISGEDKLLLAWKSWDDDEEPADEPMNELDE